MKLANKIIIIISSILLLVIGSFGIYSSFGNKSIINNAKVQDISVNISILGQDNYRIFDKKVFLSPSSKYGTTVLGALEATKVTYKVTGEGDMAYVTEINGLSQGPKSGWMYKVNSVEPTVGSAKYNLNPGDTIVWYYTTF